MSSILKSIETRLNIPPDMDEYDQDIIDYINLAFSDLCLYGVGPTAGFSIEDDSTDWDDYPVTNAALMGYVKNYVRLIARKHFEASSSGVSGALDSEIERVTWYLRFQGERVSEEAEST